VTLSVVEARRTFADIVQVHFLMMSVLPRFRLANAA
jgi:hypothetical protein